jgi:hypothetical protein
VALGSAASAKQHRADPPPKGRAGGPEAADGGVKEGARLRLCLTRWAASSPVQNGRLASAQFRPQHGFVFWRRQMRVADPAISHDEVIEIIDALTDIKAWTREILRILEDEEEDEP